VSQVVQVISATDQDLPQAGQRFSFKSPQEGVKTKNFTIRDFGSESVCYFLVKKKKRTKIYIYIISNTSVWRAKLLKIILINECYVIYIND